MTFEKTCRCVDCGKQFDFGDEGDNETYCLRCQYISCEFESETDGE